MILIDAGLELLPNLEQLAIARAAVAQQLDQGPHPRLSDRRSIHLKDAADDNAGKYGAALSRPSGEWSDDDFDGRLEYCNGSSVRTIMG